jgi:NAD(P)H-dependent FMN reductase
MKKITIVQSSLKKDSNTSIVCKLFKEKAISYWIDINYIDLRDIKLEFCDWRDLLDYNVDLQDSYKFLEESESVIFWMPVYQYSMSWVLKNFIDICGLALKWKRIWVIVNAWGPNCYMASRDLLDALYYEYGTLNISPTPYSWSMDFKGWELVNDKVIEKLDQLIKKIK